MLYFLENSCILCPMNYFPLSITISLWMNNNQVSCLVVKNFFDHLPSYFQGNWPHLGFVLGKHIVLKEVKISWEPRCDGFIGMVSSHFGFFQTYFWWDGNLIVQSLLIIWMTTSATRVSTRFFSLHDIFSMEKSSSFKYSLYECCNSLVSFLALPCLK